MPGSAKRWPLLAAAGVLALAAGACHKDQTATDPRVVSVPATRAERINAMSIEAQATNGAEAVAPVR